MKLPDVVQCVGLAAIPVGVALQFGAGWAVIAFGASATTVGTVLELERKK